MNQSTSKRLLGLLRTKTFWGGVSAIVAGAGGWATGTIDPGEALVAIVGGLGMIFIRDSNAKAEEKIDSIRAQAEEIVARIPK